MINMFQVNVDATNYGSRLVHLFNPDPNLKQSAVLQRYLIGRALVGGTIPLAEFMVEQVEASSLLISRLQLSTLLDQPPEAVLLVQEHAIVNDLQNEWGTLELAITLNFAKRYEALAPR